MIAALNLVNATVATARVLLLAKLGIASFGWSVGAIFPFVHFSTLKARWHVVITFSSYIRQFLVIIAACLYVLAHAGQPSWRVPKH